MVSADCLFLNFRILGGFLRNIYIFVLCVNFWRRCVKVKTIHDSVSTDLREGSGKPNTGISVPVIVYGELPIVLDAAQQ